MPAKSQSSVGGGTPSQAVSAKSVVISGGSSTQQGSSSQQGKSPASGKQGTSNGSAAKNNASAPPSPAATNNNNNGGGGGGAGHVRKEKKAGIVFPVGRIHRYLKQAKPKLANRIGVTAAVYLAAVLEYSVAEVIELAGEKAKEHDRKRITPRHLMLAIREDKELDTLLQKVILPQTGVVPHVHKELLEPYYFTAGVKGKQMRAKTQGGKKRTAGDEEDEQQSPKKKVAASKKNKADDKQQQQGEDEASGDEEESDDE